jgi:hypothetical protein
MPIEGYALGHLRRDNVSQFLLQLAGHAANYAQRGTFGTSEQLSLYSTLDARWRDYLPAKGSTAKPNNPAELSLDFCEPSQVRKAQLLSTSRATKNCQITPSWTLISHLETPDANGYDDEVAASVRGPGRGGALARKGRASAVVRSRCSESRRHGLIAAVFDHAGADAHGAAQCQL